MVQLPPCQPIVNNKVITLLLLAIDHHHPPLCVSTLSSFVVKIVQVLSLPIFMINFIMDLERLCASSEQGLVANVHAVYRRLAR